MLEIINARIHQKHRTIKYPDAPPPPLPDRFKGAPQINAPLSETETKDCRQLCPTGAFERTGDDTILDIGKCIFCGKCAEKYQQKISFTSQYSLTAANRDSFKLSSHNSHFQAATEINKKFKKLFGSSLKLRQVSAAGCNACEADINVLSTLAWDIGRLGIQIVASPRHADGLIVTGPVSKNMKLALEKTYEALAEPKIVIAVGACAISGGIYNGHEECCDGVSSVIPVDVFIAGCPPHPLTILDGLLRVIGRI